MSDLTAYQMKTLQRMACGQHPYGATRNLQGRGHVSKALAALHDRGFVTEIGWNALITDAGRLYLDQQPGS